LHTGRRSFRFPANRAQPAVDFKHGAKRSENVAALAS
jgi:hypothetical protein